MGQVIRAVLFGGAGQGRNAYVVQDDEARVSISIPGDPDRAARLTEEAWFRYPGPSAGGPDAWIARWAAKELGASGVELAEVEDDPGDEEEY